MTRSRCVPAVRGRTVGDGDPREVARRWAETAERVLTRAVPGVGGLVPLDVWVEATLPDTWTPGRARTQEAAFARVLGGWPSGHRVTDDDPCFGWDTGPLIAALAVWQRDPVAATIGWVGTSLGLAGGVPPGWGTHPVDTAVLDTLLDRLPTRGSDRLHLDWLGGAVPEVVGALTRAHPETPERLLLRQLRAAHHILDGTGGDLVAPDRVAVTLPGLREPVEVTVENLTTRDPRAARRFLQIFDWRPWITAARPADTGETTAVTRWLCAVAPADRGAASALLNHGLRGGFEDVGARLALRVAGVPVEAPAACGHAVEPRDAPVLWWRRLIRRLTAHPDRLRAVEDAEAAWVRLAAGA